MKRYVVVKKGETLDWSNIPTLLLEHYLWLPKVEVSSTAQVCYDNTALYVRLVAKEKHIRAEEKGELAMPSLDSCMEFFLCPVLEDERYIAIEMNPNGCMYLGIGSNRSDLMRLLPFGANPICPKTNRTEEGWEVVYSIPLTFINRLFPGCTLEHGKILRANFYKCGEKTEKPHYLSWNLVKSATPDFHRSCDFGMLELE